jgi:hypothetical protein
LAEARARKDDEENIRILEEKLAKEKREAEEATANAEKERREQEEAE